MHWLTTIYLLVTGVTYAGPTEPVNNTASIIIKEGTVTINGTLVDPQWKLSTFKSAMGHAWNSELEEDRILNYKKEGLIFWKESDNYEEITEFMIALLPDTNEYWVYVDDFFKGSLMVEGVNITSTTTPDVLKKQLPQFNWQFNTSDWYEGMYNHIYCYAQFSKDEKELIWIDFGYDDDDSWN